ncbi:MAG: hypothetical protein ACYTF1_19785 [Planctomycetota bacterium]
MCWDHVNNKALLFAGSTTGLGSGRINALLSWNGSAGGGVGDWTLEIADGAGGNPPIRWYHAAAIDRTNNKMIVHSGDAPGSPDDTWSLELSGGYVWSQESPTDSPGARIGHGMGYDQNEQEIIMVGGDGAAGSLFDTWGWSGSNWVRKAPLPTYSSEDCSWDDPKVLWLDDIEELILFGRNTGTAANGRMEIYLWRPSTPAWILAKTLPDWEYDGTNYSDPPPYPRYGFIASYNGTGQLMLSNGQSLYQWASETWTIELTKDDWSRSGLYCLNPPAEFSTELDIGKMEFSMSRLDLVLDDVPDSDGLSKFGKLFAGAGWDQPENAHTRLSDAPTAFEQVDADAITIPVKDTSKFIEKKLYMGRETISYTGTDADGFTGVTKGLYPPVGTTNFGYSYKRPQHTDPDYQQSIGEVPFSWIGRVVIIYLITYDQENNRWFGESSSELWWAGRIAGGITQNGRTKKWTLACQSIMEDLDNKVAPDFQSVELDKLVFFGQGRGIKIFEYSPSGAEAFINFKIPEGTYDTIDDLCAAFQTGANGSWTTVGGGSHSIEIIARPNQDTNTVVIWAGPKSGQDTEGYTVKIMPYPGHYCHPLAAMGFDGGKVIDMPFSRRQNKAGAVIGEKSFETYAPISNLSNGNRLYVKDASIFWDQGDDDSPHGWIKIPKTSMIKANDENAGQSAYLRYTTPNTVDNYLTIDKYDVAYWAAAAGHRSGDPPAIVQQTYIPRYETTNELIRGPFVQKLFALYSTGTVDYNGSIYDKLPLGVGLAINGAIIDSASFQEADSAIMSSDLAQRPLDVVENKSWLDWIRPECILFGYAVVWRAGRITLTKVVSPPVDDVSVTLDESNMAVADEFPDTVTDVNTVINQYEIESGLDQHTGKYKHKATIIDQDSKASLAEIKGIKFKHPGIYYDSKAADLTREIRSELLGRPLRLPSPVVSRSMAQTLVMDVWAGDVARFVSSCTNDPTGSGSRSTNILATVLKTQWRFATDGAGLMPVGSVTLMLHAQYASYGQPWAPSALLDNSISGGGWHAATYILTFVESQWGSGTDPEDGNAIELADAIYVIERGPADPDTLDIWGPFETESAYNDGTNQIKLPDGTVLTGFNYVKEHFVTAAAWPETMPDDQRTRAVWQADYETGLLDSTDKPQRYG